MLEVQICVGSSCHLKGAYEVVKIFQEMVKYYQLEDKIHLKASFCQKDCTRGVVITIGDRKITGVSPENARDIFRAEFIKKGEE